MKELKLKVDRVEEGIAVCYLPEGGMTDIPLPDNMIEKVKDGATVTAKYNGDSLVFIKVSGEADPKSKERHSRLKRLFKR